MSTIIGRNIRPGMTPGGFTKTISASSDKLPARKKMTIGNVMLAAKAYHEPNPMRDSTHESLFSKSP